MCHFLNVSYSSSNESSIAISSGSDQEAIECSLWWLDGMTVESVVSAFLYRSPGRGETRELIGNFQFDHNDGKFIFLPA